ncbi:MULTISPECIES: response regulator [Niastella]|uniref:Response regulator transcription factor n=1 Tax=Niastella soli TaxID=2821487 RepID=A0ABS3YVJ1_9BACT|nr:response regulator [Niastella soli]MBO9201849.1 response regulator transcription factor [Niastella soli]
MTSATKIALIDSHPLMRECISNYLSGFEYAITLQVDDGKELIDRLTKENVPDVCLLEFNARKKVGYETIKMLKSACPHMKIAIYSMQTGPVENQIPSGADVVISDQTSIAEFKSTLDKLI